MEIDVTEDMKENDATRYLVVKMGNGQRLEQAWTIVSVHAAPGDAQSDAEVSASKDTEGYIWGVYQKVGTARLIPKIEWKGAAR
jgi:hypothetical protein